MTEGPATTRDRILDAALELTALKGSDGTSMRELAAACGINVAALYYHFPSKADLLRAVIEERHYDLLMGLVSVPPASAGTNRERLHRLICDLWEGTRAEERIWRLLLAESCHRNPDAEEVAAMLVGRFEEAVGSWLGQFERLEVPGPIAAGLVVDLMLANMARVAIGAVTDSAVFAAAGDLASVIAGDD